MFTQLHQTIEELDDQFVLADNIDDELSLLERYLTIKEMSSDLAEEINKLNVKINNFEREHGLSELSTKDYTPLPTLDLVSKTVDNEEIVIELEEQDFLIFQSSIGFYDLLMYDQAMINLDEIIKKYPDFNLARVYMAMTFFKKKQYTEAKREVLLLLKLSEDSELLSLSHNILGMIYSNENNFDKAIEHFKQAIILKGNWNEAKFNLAIVLMKNKMVREAIDLLEELYQHNENDWEVLILLGRAYHTLRHFDLAKEFYRQAFAVSKKPIAIKQLIRHFENNNDFEKAIYWYKKWLEYEPKSILAINGIAKALWLIDKQNEAEAMIKKALTLEPSNKDSLLLFAWLQTINNNLNAIKAINQIAGIENDSKSSESIIAANLARLYYLNKNYESANGFCEMLLSSDSASIRGLGHIVKGLIYLDRHEPKKALYHLEESVTAGLNFPNLNFYIGYSYFLIGDIEQVKIHWNNVMT